MSEVEARFCTELLAAAHDVSAFSSGEDETDMWLRCNALRAQQQGCARTRVLVHPGQTFVLGYYAVAPHDTYRENLPAATAGGLSIVPGYLIAQLAVDRSIQGQGMGAELLYDALQTIGAASDVADGRLVIVDALHEQAARFYERFGFTRISRTSRLYVKISRIRSSLAVRLTPIQPRRPEFGFAQSSETSDEALFEPMSEEDLSLWEDGPVFPKEIG